MSSYKSSRRFFSPTNRIEIAPWVTMQAVAEVVMAHDEDDADEPKTTAADGCRLCGEPSVAEEQRHPIIVTADIKAAVETDDDIGTRPGLRDVIVKHLRIKVRITVPKPNTYCSRSTTLARSLKFAIFCCLCSVVQRYPLTIRKL